jgi:hypothetical protein
MIFKLLFKKYLGSTLQRTTSDDEMTKKKGLHLKTCYFQIYIGFKLYKRSSNYHPRGDLKNHPYF